jgi:hypothetical protein
MKLTVEEAAEARRRRLEYEHSMAIEGIHLTAEEKSVFDEIERLRLGHDDAFRFVEDWLRKKGVIPDHAANAAE